MLPMVVLAGGGFALQLTRCRPDHLRRRAGKWLGKLELGYRKPGQYQPGPQRLGFHQCDSEQHFLQLAAFTWCFGNDTSGFTNLTFWINGGTGGQAVLVQGIWADGTNARRSNRPLPTNLWRQVTLSMSALVWPTKRISPAFGFRPKVVRPFRRFMWTTFSGYQCCRAGTNAPVPLHQRIVKSNPDQPADLWRCFRLVVQRIAGFERPLHRSGGTRRPVTTGSSTPRATRRTGILKALPMRTRLAAMVMILSRNRKMAARRRC